MSFDYNYKFWVATQKDLDDILKRQEVYKRLKPIEKPQLTHYLFAELYARYVQLVNKLGYIYHHTFQVQKRDVVKQLVECATQRLLELKNELKNLELSEFVYIDKTLIERRLTPDDVTVWTPKYFPFSRPANVQDMIYGHRKKATDEGGKIRNLTAAAQSSHLFSRESTMGIFESKSRLSTVQKGRLSVRRHTKIEIVTDPVKQKLTDVATLIQSHERARRARVLLTNIHYNPAVYKPKIRDDGATVKYTFTHKSNQAMLIPVRRTRFEADYYLHRKDLKEFNYYVKPVYQPVSQIMQDDLSDFDDSEEEKAEEELDESVAEEGSYEGSEYSEYSEESVQETPEELATRLMNAAALRIQTFWKGHRDRKIYRALLEKKMLICGMIQGFRPNSKKVEMYEERMKEAAKHRLLKEKYDEEFIKFCADERARILRVRGPWIMEDISDNIREWFRQFYDRLNCFHPYPDEVKGGTLLLLRGETMDIYEYQEKLKRGKVSKEEQKKIRDKEREMKKKIKEKLKKQKIALAKTRAKLKAAGIYDLSDEMERSKSIEQIQTTIEKYKKEWKDIDEKLNKNHGPITEWITSDYYAEIHEELQLIVDELMRLEYELLQQALAKDKKKKYKPPKKKKPKATKRGKKPPKDMTGNRSIESLFNELKDAGIVQNYPRKTMDYFIGERNHCAYEILNIRMKDTPVYKGEIKDVMSELILGMGPLNITKPKSICLIGPTHCGKKLLCDILATEIDAVVLDISPEKTARFQGDMKYFMHVIMKMAKILQPTILYIKDVHRVFWKKVPPEFEDIVPRLLQPQIKKFILKPLKKTDKVYLLGTTDAPWTANGKMKNIFQRLLLLPKTEYATSFMLHRNVTLQIPKIPRDFSFSPLALVNRDYSSGDIVQNIEETLNLRRRMDLVHRPLHQMEFIDNLLNKQSQPNFPPDAKEWEKFVKWFRKANKMARKRVKMMKQREELLARTQKNKKK